MTLFEIDPSSVVAGWVPLAMTAILAVAMVFLFRSMRKQMRRIELPDSTDAVTRHETSVRVRDERVDSPGK